jgi:hypothetical protein
MILGELRVLPMFRDEDDVGNLPASWEVEVPQSEDSVRNCRDCDDGLFREGFQRLVREVVGS